MKSFPKPVKREKARKPLQRTWMRRKRSRRVARQTDADRAYLAFLHTLPCVLEHDCRGRIEASHLRNHTGLGLKEPDTNAVPMCSGLHADWEQHRGIFRGWTNLERFACFMQWIAETQAKHRQAA